MKEGKQYSFWQLVSSEKENTAILIPQIQRDYIQYRTGKVEANLSRFLQNLISSITAKNNPINLNFIYGNTSKVYEADCVVNAFIPIDGQQRLTTLFLLHYYVFNEAETSLKNDLKKHFYYKTRSTTQDFLDSLIEKNNKKFYDNDRAPSEIIRDTSWYSSLWDFDPSVLSCLKVLDQINKTFIGLCKKPNWNDLTASLTSDYCPITFMKLEIEGIDKPNELYIKMNSRGKQLTAFENFKTELYGYINEYPQNFPPAYKQKMDGDWLSYLWELCVPLKEDACEKYTDVLYRELLHWIIVNRICCFKNADNITDSFKSIFNTDTPEKFYLYEYKAEVGKEEFISAIQDIYYTMNLLSHLKDKTKESVTKNIFGLSYDKGIFSCDISQYMQRALIFAVTKYATTAKVEETSDISSFSSWWRVAKNLITNSQIDSLKTCLSAIHSINRFEYTTDIADYLVKADETAKDQKFIDLPALNPIQCQEEILKQKIICFSAITEWKDTIYNAEENSYFNGEIFFALKLAGVNNQTDANQENLKLFNENWQKIKEIFDEPRDDGSIHRLLLVYGDYSEEMSKYADDNYLLSYYFNDTKHHNQDWRGLLRSDNKLELFGQMLGDFKASDKSFTKFAHAKCNNIKNLNYETVKQELHLYMIKYPEVFEYIKSFGRCWCWKDYIYLLRTSTRGSFINYKLFIVFCQLDKQEKNVKTYEGKGDERDFISINGENYYCEPQGFYTDDKNGKIFVASTIDEMVKKFV